MTSNLDLQYFVRASDGDATLHEGSDTVECYFRSTFCTSAYRSMKPLEDFDLYVGNGFVDVAFIFCITIE